jgi:hypothetical protein
VKEAFPLNWPPSWKRTAITARVHGSFGTKKDGGYGLRDVTIAEAVGRVLFSLDMMKVPSGDTLISTNNAVRRDGVPYTNRGMNPDPGVAVYWKVKGKERCMAIDRYDSIAGNLAAIAASLEALRSVARHGSAEILDRAFTGFAALPAAEQWFQVLGVGVSATEVQIRDAYQRLAHKHHPDLGGDEAAMSRINRARDQGLEQFS